MESTGDRVSSTADESLPDSSPPPPPPRPNASSDLHFWGVALSIFGTFLATLFGVFLAQTWAESARERADRKAYATLIQVMSLDCQRSLALNGALREKQSLEPIVQSPFLHIGALENALLLRFMKVEEQRILMAGMSSAAAAEAAYSEMRARIPPQRVYEVMPPEDRDRVAQVRDALAPLLEDTLDAYLNAQRPVCEMLVRSAQTGTSQAAH